MLCYGQVSKLEAPHIFCCKLKPQFVISPNKSPLFKRLFCPLSVSLSAPQFASGGLACKQAMAMAPWLVYLTPRGLFMLCEFCFIMLYRLFLTFVKCYCLDLGSRLELCLPGGVTSSRRDKSERQALSRRVIEFVTHPTFVPYVWRDMNMDLRKEVYKGTEDRL